MNKRQLLISTLSVLLLSAMAISTWLFEIVQLKGWKSLNWLAQSLFSPYIVTLLVAIAFISPFMITGQLKSVKAIIAILFLYLINLLCFLEGRELCYELYCRLCFWTKNDMTVKLILAGLLFIFLGFAYWLTTNLLIKKNRKLHILYLSLTAFLSFPLSLITIQIVPGFGSQTDWVDAVKMGYPAFWFCMTLGVSGILLAKQK